jgi:mannosyltransferase OCH1-like enzyme
MMNNYPKVKIRKWMYGPPCKVGDKKGEKGGDFVIPAQVVQTWEHNRIPLAHFLQLSRIRNRNKELDFFFFDRAKRDHFMTMEWGSRKISNVYFASRFGSMRADIFRYCYLYSNGGYYFDISKGVRGSIRHLHEPSDSALISFEGNTLPSADNLPSPGLQLNKNLVIQWGFGFSPQHPILEIMIDMIEKDSEKFEGITFESPREAIYQLTGPIQFTRAVHEYARILNPSMRGITQAGVDFNGSGIYSMLGSGWRHLDVPSYWRTSNSSIYL